MTFSLADELDPLGDPLNDGLLHPLDPMGDSLGGGGLGSAGVSLADELDGPGPEDLGAMGGMGSLALELEQNEEPEPPRLSPVKSLAARGRRRSPSALSTPSRRRDRVASQSNGLPKPSMDEAPPSNPHPPSDPFGENSQLEENAESALNTMHDALATSSNLVALLKDLDRPVSTSARIAGHRPNRSSQPPLLEHRLQAHLARLGEAERLREEQAREVAQLARELANVRGECLDVNFVTLAELLTPAGSPPTPGWTGEMGDTPLSPVTNGFRRRANGVNGFHALESIAESQPSHPLSPTSPTLPLSPTSPSYPSPMSPTSPYRNRSLPLPTAAASLVDETAGLTSTLSTLSESVSLALARHAADGRMLRRARAGLKDWHEREAAEEACQRGIDVWEERVARGDVPNARAEMDAMLKGFSEVLEVATHRVFQLQPVREMEIGVAL